MQIKFKIWDVPPDFITVRKLQILYADKKTQNIILNPKKASIGNITEKAIQFLIYKHYIQIIEAEY